MSERRLYLFVEGNDDERFFAKIVVPLLEPQYKSVHIVKFACMKRVNVCRLIRSIHRMNDEYLLFTDIDNEPGVKAKKHILMERFDALDTSHIVVVIREIESWYLAGLDDAAELELSLPHHPSTDSLSKEYFNSHIPRRFRLADRFHGRDTRTVLDRGCVQKEPIIPVFRHSLPPGAMRRLSQRIGK